MAIFDSKHDSKDMDDHNMSQIEKLEHPHLGYGEDPHHKHDPVTLAEEDNPNVHQNVCNRNAA